MQKRVQGGGRGFIIREKDERAVENCKDEETWKLKLFEQERILYYRLITPAETVWFQKAGN